MNVRLDPSFVFGWRDGDVMGTFQFEMLAQSAAGIQALLKAQALACFGLPGKGAGPSIFENFNFRLNRTRAKLIETAYFFAISCENRSKHAGFASCSLAVAAVAT